MERFGVEYEGKVEYRCGCRTMKICVGKAPGRQAIGADLELGRN